MIPEEILVLIYTGTTRTNEEQITQYHYWFKLENLADDSKNIIINFLEIYLINNIEIQT